MKAIVVHVPKSQLTHLFEDKGNHENEYAWWYVPTIPKKFPEKILFEHGGKVIAQADFQTATLKAEEGQEPKPALVWFCNTFEAVTTDRPISAPNQGYKYVEALS